MAGNGGITLASALTEAHRSGNPVSAASLDPPPTLEAAEAVQCDVAERLGAEVGGWKIGFTPDGETPVAAPLFRHLIQSGGGVFPRRAATFLAVEVEIGFRLRADAEATDPEAALGPAVLGIEVVCSRFVEGPKVPFPAFLADNIANGAYLVGSERADWRDLALDRLRCRVWQDDVCLHDDLGGHPQGNPLVPLGALGQRPVTRLGGLRAGQVVTTGTLCGVLRLAGPCRIRAELEGFEPLALAITD